jgi:restriction endonuclease Mrr
VFPSRAYSHWEVDEESGEQVHLTYAERFPRQYQQFKQKQQQTKSGTPLDYVPFLTDAKRAELRALSIYTVETLAELDGQPLKNLGIGGRDFKNKAIEYLASATHEGTVQRQQAQIEALMSQIRLMEDDKKMLVTAGPKDPERDPIPPEPPEPRPGDEDHDDNDGEGDDERTVPPGPNTAAELIGMNRSELRAFITERTGKRPVGNPSMRTLTRMAQEVGR